MKTYCIFKKYSKNSQLEVTETGFSFLALFFGPFWAISQKLWSFSLIGFLLLLISKFLSIEMISNNFFYFVFFSSNVFWGIFARDLYIQKLLDNKYYAEKMIVADSKKKALLIFLSESN